MAVHDGSHKIGMTSQQSGSTKLVMQAERSPSGSNPRIELPHGQGEALARVVMAGIAEVTSQTVDKIGAFDLRPPGMGQNFVRKHQSQKIASDGCRAVAVSGMRYGDAQALFKAGGDTGGGFEKPLVLALSV